MQFLKKYLILSAAVIMAQAAVAQVKSQTLPTTPLVIGKTIAFPSAVLGETRTINVYLPEDYDPKDSLKYPVIYIPDGGIDEDFLHITGVVKYYTQPWVARFPRSIVVGIENTNRRRDFTFAVPNLDFVEKIGYKKTQFPAYGGSAKYIAFIASELQPYINSQWKTDSHNTIVGESLAGLLATEILLKQRELFDTYIIIAPSLWWGDRSLLAEAPRLLKTPTKRPIKVYLAAASQSEDAGMHEVAVALKGILEQQTGGTITTRYDYLPDEIHATIMHQAVYNAFKMLYPKTANQK